MLDGTEKRETHLTFLLNDMLADDGPQQCLHACVRVRVCVCDSLKRESG